MESINDNPWALGSLSWYRNSRMGESLKKTLTITLCIAAVGVPSLLMWQGKRFHRLWCEYQGREASREALKLIAKGDKPEAISVLCQVLPKCGHQAEVLRTLAKASEDLFPAKALDCYRILEAQKVLTVTDEARMAVLLVKTEDHMDGVLRINRLLRMQPAHMDVCRAKADIAKLLTTTPSADDLPGKPMLASMALGFLPGELATVGDANFPMARTEVTTPDAMTEELQRAVRTYPLPLSSRSALLRRAAFRKILSRALPQNSPGVMAAAVRILKAENESQLIVDFISRAQALRHEDLFTACVDALMETHRFPEAAALAASKSAPIPICTQWTLRALVELHLPAPNRKRAGGWLRAAVEAAEADGRIAAIEAAGRVAFDNGLHAIAAEAFGQVLLAGGASPRAATDYLAAARMAGVPAEMVTRIVSARSKNDPLSLDLAKRTAYFKLLVGNDIEAVSQNVERWVANSPDDPYSRLLEAMSAYRFSDFAHVVQVLTRLPPCQWHKGEIAVMAGMAARAGRMADAEALSKGVTPDGLFDEEIRFLKSAKTAEHALPVTAMSP